MALSENNGHSVSPRDVVRSWAEFFHIVKPPLPPAEVVFLETGIVPEGSGRIETRPVYELDMKNPPPEGQLYLWHAEDDNNLPAELREITIFIPNATKAITDVPVTRAETPHRQSVPHSINLVLGLQLTPEGKR